MTKVLLCFLTALTLAWADPEPASAQGRITSARLEELRAKVEHQRDSYYRFEHAEQEATSQGSPERAEVFRQAKLKAYEAYVTTNAEYQKAQLDKREQDRKEALKIPDR